LFSTPENVRLERTADVSETQFQLSIRSVIDPVSFLAVAGIAGAEQYQNEAFAKGSLADDLRKKMLVSPLSAFEVLAQLPREDCGDDVLRQIKAIRNWTDPSHGRLLPWPDDWLYYVWFQQQKPDNGFAKKMGNAFSWCMTADSPTSLTEHSGKRQRNTRSSWTISSVKRQKNLRP
jgi:hypothetical protein